MTGRLVTVLAVATTLVAGAPAPAGAEPPDPCILVSKADAAKAMGSPIVSVKGLTAGPSRSCSFHGAKPLQAVVVTAFRYGSAREAHTRFIDIVKQTASAAATPAAKLNGVGDEAVSINSNVYVRKGSDALVFNIFGIRGPPLTARAVALAKHTLAHLH
ncbi:MAG TPA: hypothetical protein VGT98_05910 [Candidatus Elarobacter sp.]|nr:hypothetical protein [Candidatus Elarobacter sp.]HEV2737310.1 hypothetical protein [Candidatus Elarobacter sp.]